MKAGIVTNADDVAVENRLLVIKPKDAVPKIPRNPSKETNENATKIGVPRNILTISPTIARIAMVSFPKQDLQLCCIHRFDARE